MCLICDHCGAELKQYRDAFYTYESVEEELSKFFAYDIKDIMSPNIKNPYWNNAKKVCLTILYLFTGDSLEAVCNRYGASKASLNTHGKRYHQASDPQFNEIYEILSKRMPVKKRVHKGKIVKTKKQ